MSKGTKQQFEASQTGGFGNEGPELELDGTRDAWGELPLKFDAFTASDRCAALRHFLADERVRTAVAQAQVAGR